MLSKEKLSNTIAGIFDLILGALSLIGLILFNIYKININNLLTSPMYVASYIFSIIFFSIIVTGFIFFGIKTLFYNKYDTPKYIEKSGMFLTFAIIELLTCIIVFISTISQFNILLLSFFICNLLIIILRTIACLFINKTIKLRKEINCEKQ